MTPSSALSELPLGSCATLGELRLPADVQELLMSMGFVPEARVLALHRAPAGDPTVYCVDGAEIALRRETARFITIRDLRIAGQAGAAGQGGARR